MTKLNIHRRTVLRAAGVALSLPWMEAMLPATRALGADKVAPLRLGFLYVPNGMHMPHWTPDKEGDNYDLKPILEPLAHQKQNINVLTGLTLDGARAHQAEARQHGLPLAVGPVGLADRHVLDHVDVDQPGFWVVLHGLKRDADMPRSWTAGGYAVERAENRRADRVPLFSG